ncbi:MAG: hypothetical protein P1R58_12810 [bacterium]|nr:hypothetical protein [bacterium]
MKNFLAVPAILLVLMVVFVGGSYAATEPYDYRDVSRPDGDDHPWGGEQFEEPIVPLKVNQTRFPIITSIGSLDFLFATYLEFFYDNPRPITKSDPVVKDIVVNSDPQSYDVTTETNQVSKGN